MYWHHLNYLPLSPGPFLLLLAVLALFAILIYYGVLPYAYRQLGLSVWAVLGLLTASLLGGYVNIPLAHFPEKTVFVQNEFDPFGAPFALPDIIDWPGTIVAVNVGGAIIPIALSIYLLVRNGLWYSGIIATVCVSAVCYALAFPVAGKGIAIPALAPPIATGIIASFVSWRDAPALAYISGSLGVLIGADLLNMRTIGNMGAPLASIGGAGTFDGIFMTGIMALLLASLLHILERWLNGPSTPRRKS